MYFARMIVVMKYVIDHVDTQTHYKQRAIKYALGLITATLIFLIVDLACTVNLHSTNLGLTIEDDGRLYMDNKMFVRVYIAENFFQLTEKTKHINRENHGAFSESVRNLCTRKDLRSEIRLSRSNRERARQHEIDISRGRKKFRS